MSLWVDVYRPTSLSKLSYHVDQADHLKKLVQSNDFPHLLVFGPTGSGKSTRIFALLRELYGPGVEKKRIEHKNFEAPSGKKLEITTVASNYHIELSPSDVGIYDRVVIQEIIKTMAQTHQLDSASQKEFKVVLLKQVDKLTKDAQHALRRTMEKYSQTCRLVLCCQSTSKIIPALRSRCLSVRVPAPSVEQIGTILHFIAKKESLNLPVELSTKISTACNGNLRRAILMLETAKVQQYPFSPSQRIIEPDWEIFVRETASSICSEQSPKRLLEVRGKIYELLTHCIPPDVIFRTLVPELIKSVDLSIKSRVIQLAAEHEHRLHMGSKAIYHLEAFIAKFMVVYKNYIDESCEDLDDL